MAAPHRPQAFTDSRPLRMATLALLGGLSLNMANATEDRPKAPSPPPQAASQAQEKSGAGEHKHSHGKRPLPAAPLGRERTPSQPLPPLPPQR